MAPAGGCPHQQQAPIRRKCQPLAVVILFSFLHYLHKFCICIKWGQHGSMSMPEN